MKTNSFGGDASGNKLLRRLVITGDADPVVDQGGRLQLVDEEVELDERMLIVFGGRGYGATLPKWMR